MSLQDSFLNREVLNRIKEAKALMEENLETPLSIKQLSRKVSMAESHFHRTFKEVTGTTPYQYYLKIRLAYASKLLEKNNISIEQISRASGFIETSSFSRTFKNHFGKSPADYRTNFLSAS